MLVLKNKKKNLQNCCADATMRVKLEIGKCLHDDYHDSNNLSKEDNVLKNLINNINNYNNKKINEK